MTESLDFDVTNVGGVEHVELRLRPGANVIRGPNGIGKTSTIRSVARAAGGKGELEPRDGAPKGKISGPGVLVHVGKVTRTSKTDDPAPASLALAEVGPLSRLIDPRINDPNARSRARLRALVDLLGVQVDDDAVEILAQGDEKAAAWLREELAEGAIEDLDVAEKKVKGHFEGRARRFEAQAEEQEGVVGAARDRGARILDEIGGERHLVEVDVEQAQQALDEGIRKHERAKARCEAREALEERQARIRESIGERPDMTEAQAKLEAAQERHQGCVERIEQLERELAAARADRDAAESDVERWSGQLADQSAAAERWDEQQAILAETPEGPTREELAELEAQLVTEPRERLEAARQSAAYREAVTEQGKAAEEKRIAEREAQHLRGLAKSLPARLGEILAKAGAPGITIVDGRIQVVDEQGNTFDWDTRRSDGQRVSAACDIAVNVYPAGSVIAFEGSLWTALDPAHRRELGRRCAEAGLHLVTEETDDGGFRVEHVA